MGAARVEGGLTVRVVNCVSRYNRARKQRSLLASCYRLFSLLLMLMQSNDED